jgi:hypothetical protein
MRGGAHCPSKAGKNRWRPRIGKLAGAVGDVQFFALQRLSGEGPVTSPSNQTSEHGERNAWQPRRR